MQKLKNFVKRFIKKDGLIYKVIRKIYHILSAAKYKITNGKQIKEKQKYYSEQVDNAKEIIKKYQGKDYVVFYNPTWLGVANSTKGLFKNIVPLEHVYKERDIKKIAQAINENNIKSVILSQICDGWTSIIKEIKKINMSFFLILHGI